MSRYRLSKRAQRDLFDIFIFGIQQFGERQAEAYAASLEHCFSLLGDNPRMGRLAETIAPAVRRHEHRAHIVLYEQSEEGVLILAVVHGASVRRLRLD